MATGTNTVTLFLRRRNNADAYNVEEAIKKCFVSLHDVTINGIEKPLAKYVSHVWDTISLEDYKTLLQKSPNKNVEQHEIYKEYTKKIKVRDNLSPSEQEQERLTKILAVEQDKLLYFILAYPQKLVLVKTGEKDAEKRFLGYEFSNRRGSEGIHAIQRSKSIDECTQLYDAESVSNPDKASTYIYKAFLGEFDVALPEHLRQNISYHNLVDMFTFDRVDFEKSISLSAKKKVKFESKWEVVKLSNVIEIIGGGTPDTANPDYWNGNISWLSVVDFNKENRFVDKTEKTITENGLKNSSTKLLNEGDLIISARGTVGALAQLKKPMAFNQSCYGLRGNSKLNNGFLY